MLADMVSQQLCYLFVLATWEIFEIRPEDCTFDLYAKLWFQSASTELMLDMQENYLRICQEESDNWAHKHPLVTPLTTWDLPALTYNPHENHEYLAMMAKPEDPEEKEVEDSSLQQESPPQGPLGTPPSARQGPV